LDFGDKVKLQQLGIDPQDIDNPVVLARIREEAPEIADKLEPFFARLEGIPPSEKIATALTADGNIIGLSKQVWTSKNSGVLGDELASELHQFLLAGTQTGGRKLHKDVRFIDELYEAYAPVREALREEFGDTIRLVRYQRGVEGPGDRLVVQFADPTFSKNFDPRVAPPTDAIGFTKGPAVDRELQRISRLTGQSRKDAYAAFKESALNKELEKTIEATRLKDKTPVFRYEVDVPIEDIVAMPTSTNGKYREFIVNSDVLRGVDATELPRAADGSLARVVEEVAEVVPKVVDPNILEKWVIEGGKSGLTGGELEQLRQAPTEIIDRPLFRGANVDDARREIRKLNRKKDLDFDLTSFTEDEEFAEFFGALEGFGGEQVNFVVEGARGLDISEAVPRTGTVRKFFAEQVDFGGEALVDDFSEILVSGKYRVKKATVAFDDELERWVGEVVLEPIEDVAE
ncbi:hypothetical protein LCGC14_2623910, partial [marine sediment metagenome]